MSGDVRDNDIKVPANSQVTINKHVSFIRCLSAEKKIVLEWDNGRMPFESGSQYRSPSPEGIKEFRFVNPHDNDIDITYVAGWGDVKVDKLNLEGSFTVRNGKNVTGEVKTVNTTATEIAPYEYDRTAILLQNNSNIEIWVGDSTVDNLTKKGWKIAIGGNLTLSVCSAIYAIAQSTANLSYLKITE